MRGVRAEPSAWESARRGRGAGGVLVYVGKTQTGYSILPAGSERQECVSTSQVPGPASLYDLMSAI